MKKKTSKKTGKRASTKKAAAATPTPANGVVQFKRGPGRPRKMYNQSEVDTLIGQALRDAGCPRRCCKNNDQQTGWNQQEANIERRMAEQRKRINAAIAADPYMRDDDLV